MRVAIGPLARSGLESRVGSDLTASVRAALLFYVQRLTDGRPPVRYPDFLAVAGPGGPDPEASIEIEVDAELEAEFERAAAEQGVTVPELAGHAVLLYLAEVDLVEEREVDLRHHTGVAGDRERQSS